MKITCPQCHSEATLLPNPGQDSLPHYLLACSGCDGGAPRHDNEERLVAALVGSRHGSGSHELTVAAESIGRVSFFTDPTGQESPTVEHSELLEYVTSSINAADTFSLLLRTVEVGSRCPTPDGAKPYKAVRGWAVLDGEIHALTGQEVWEASCKDARTGASLEPDCALHYVDADDIPRPYRW